jgi:hypothetical protein
LFWTSIALIVVVTLSVSLVFSIGSEPLPGILGIAKKA